MATPNRVGLLISQSNCEFLTTRGSNHNVKRGQYILTGLFDGDLSSPCYKDRRRILCRLFRAPWWFRPRHLTPHPVSQPGFLPVIILATAGLRLLIREGPPPYIAANLHANVKAVSHVATRGRTIVAGQSAREKRLILANRRESLLTSLDRFSIAVEYVL